MKNIQGTPEQRELIKKMGSGNKIEQMEAQNAFAALITEPVLKAIKEEDLVSNIYEDIEFNDTENPTIPLDLYYDVNYAGLISVWAGTLDEGMATNFVDVPTKELQVTTFDLKSAISFYRKHALNGRLDVVSDSLELMVQEFVHKKNVNGFNTILAALAKGNVKNGQNVAAGTSGAIQNVMRSAGASLQMKDISDLMVRHRRIATSRFGGTPVGYKGMQGLDMYASPEVFGQVREFSFNPLRSDSAVTTSNSTNIPASERARIFAAGGATEFAGLMWHELNELGLSKPFNDIFDTYADSTSYLRVDGSNGSQFTSSSDEILLLVDSRRRALRRAVVLNSDSGKQLLVAADDQFSARTKKMGFYAEMTENYLCLDSRSLTGLMLG